MEEEISLREIIEVVWRGRKIIALITIISTLFSAFLSFFVIKPTYEASTKIVVTDVTPSTGFFGSDTTVIIPGNNSSGDNIYSDVTDKDISSLLSSLLKYPDMTVDTFKEEVTNPVVLQDAISQLKLNDRYTIDDLKSRVNVTVIDKTNLIDITVKDNNPRLAMEIADTIAEKFRDYIINRNNKQTDKLMVTLGQLIKLQNEKIDKATQDLNEALNTNDKTLISEKQTKLNLLKKSRDIMMEKYNMLELIKASKLGEQSILITNKALLPEQPVSPKKLLNISIAFILGIMVSVFVVFFMEYWKNSSDSVKLNTPQ
ncbi:YveK family protein [Caldanaerobius polysaccharolyticus]|uniref:YveK family protein n=1 Tax=Caldanaerobius polysaccharolyticus TaxID=44256 RepID=UPI0004793524|nr:Wzz/FepE/Etk N-terminal domain-containing protein [Caldanaerobius polysaccharolyticus]